TILSRRSECSGPCGGLVANGMKKISYSGYRFPSEIINQAVWLYLRFTLSFRDVEDLLAERGIMVSADSIRRWVSHFGPMIAADGATTGLKTRISQPTTGTQDAGFQKPRISPEISLDPRRRLQHLQRPATPDILPNGTEAFAPRRWTHGRPRSQPLNQIQDEG